MSEEQQENLTPEQSENQKVTTAPEEEILAADTSATTTGEAEEIENLKKEVEQLKNELKQSKAKSQEYLEGWQRALADFSNFRKRVDRDQAQTYQMAAGSIIKRYLEILDDLERALKNKPQSGEGAEWAQGIELIYHKFMGVLKAEGVQPMEVDGKFFDPNMHEAITQEDSPDHESGQVISVVHQGYMLGDRVLRPALVRVAR
ncbi:MAG: nucleotide exchange factor GrpE [Omnitrophica WOR_2 bacterium]